MKKNPTKASLPLFSPFYIKNKFSSFTNFIEQECTENKKFSAPSRFKKKETKKRNVSFLGQLENLLDFQMSLHSSTT